MSFIVIEIKVDDYSVEHADGRHGKLDVVGKAGQSQHEINVVRPPTRKIRNQKGQGEISLLKGRIF
uniref:Uncharacterized protein n=1 Tax=Candidatus Kentrum sp. DK TaxID=2126562 RepID=A0A450TQA1_9GAMM|nr:MAG: hypothetical protein BECKDK2373B_GA0170837_12712 [Candidatus Kentron sp. DK]